MDKLRPYIFLDVDGVLNFFSKRPVGFVTQGTVNGCTYQLRMNKDHGQWLLDLAEKTGAELAWGTTWQHQANTEVGPQIGLPELPVVTFRDDERTTVSWWKGNGVNRFAGKRPFVWFDDEWDLENVMADLTITPHKIIRVSPEVWLLKAHVDEAYDWLMAL